MTYNEWRDELKSNLLSVSESERRRVLDYYAEAYADRRDAGYSEREIIEDFGAPYDAALRILDGKRETYDDDIYERSPRRSARETRREERERRREEERRRDEERRREYDRTREERYSAPSDPPAARREDYTWVFVLLCVIFCVPLFGAIMSLVGITIAFCVAPFGVLIGGVATMGGGIGAMVAGDFVGGLVTFGTGLIIFGISIILLPLFIKLVKLMWKLFVKLFNWVKSLFSGREAI